MESKKYRVAYINRGGGKIQFTGMNNGNEIVVRTESNEKSEFIVPGDVIYFGSTGNFCFDPVMQSRKSKALELFGYSFGLIISEKYEVMNGEIPEIKHGFNFMEALRAM